VNSMFADCRWRHLFDLGLAAVLREAFDPFEVLAIPYMEQKFHTLTRNFVGDAMELFQAEMVAAIEHQSGKTCRRCNARLHLVKVMVDSGTGDVVHMFECQCGERIWIE
jgi:hypothetical protein